MNYIILFISFLLLFVGTNVQTTLGVDTKLFYSAIIAVSIFLCLQRKKLILKNKSLITLIVLVSLYSIFKIYTDKGEGTRMMVLQIIGTPFIFAAFPLLTEAKRYRYLKIWRGFALLFFFSFLFETGLAIVERIISYNFFEWKIGDDLVNFADAFEGFRSSALYGHPLYNALIVSTSMAFILISPLKVKYKYLLWGLGYIAILSFNTRSSIVGNILFFLIYILYTVFFDNKMNLKNRHQILLASIIISSVGLFFFFKLGFGSRLIKLGLLDDSSAQTRVDTWSIFNYVISKDILWGISNNKMQYLMYRAGLIATENFWIDQLFRFGIIFYIFYVWIYIVIIKNLYKGYSTFSALFTSGSFILIASTNNSLSTNFLALLIYLLLIVMFNPKYFNLLISRKYQIIIPKEKLNDKY